MKKCYLFISLFYICSLGIFAQTPQKMSYQAIVRNSSDMILANQSVGIQISILKGSANGLSVYVETQNPSTNTNGLLSIEIGNGTLVSGNFTTIDWSTDIYFIKTEIDTAGGANYTITGTSQLMSVPYALHAKTAESITGTITETDPVFTASAANGISGSDITSWNNKLDTEVDGSVTNEIELPTGGTDGQVLKTDGSGNYAWVDQTDTQDLSITGNTISLVNGGSVDISTTTAVTANTAKVGLPSGGTAGQILNINGSGNPVWTNAVSGLEYGDIKTGIQSSDHNGWLLLDGRALSTLTTNQQAQAATLGLSGNLPDARDKYLSYSTLGSSTFGSNTVTLSKANLPTDTFSGATNYLYDNTPTITPGQFGLLRLSAAGENVTTNTTDVPGASVEADLITTPIDHQHNFSLQLNNTQTAIDNRPASLNVRMFIYLGE